MKKKFFYSLLYLNLIVNWVNAQGVSNIWITGYDHWAGLPYGNTVIDFKTSPPSIAYQNMSLSFRRTCATIADTSGNLLFYTNGFAVCNANADTMPNGAGLDSSSIYSQWYSKGMPVTQGALILKQPSSDSLYYMFHETAHPIIISQTGTAIYPTYSLFYSIIDMNADSGRGDIIVKQQDAFNDTLAIGRITAVKHANGRDWWITVYKYEGNTYITLLMSPNGLSTPYYQQIGPYLQFNSLGQAVYNPQGNKYANVDDINHLLIMDFDRCSGLFSNPLNIAILDSSFARGAAFSPNGRYLYIASNKYLYQYDVLASNIDSSRQTVAVWDSFFSPSPPFAATFYNMQLAPDGKIYIAPPNSVQVLHTIDYPDSVGLACGVCQHCVATPAFYGYTLPNHPNYFLGPELGSVCDSLPHVGLTEHPLNNESIKVFSNPNNGNFTLWFNVHDKQGLFQIYDVNGNLILQENVVQWSQYKQVDITKHSGGIYFVKMSWSNSVGSVKVIKE